MTSKWLRWAATAAFVLGCGLSFGTSATGSCSACFSACRTAYNACLASGQSAPVCLSQYTNCRGDCAC